MIVVIQKEFFMKAIFLLLSFCTLSFAAGVGTPFTMAIVDTTSSNITTGYDGAAAAVKTNLAGAKHLLVWNAIGDDIGVSLPDAAGCVVSSPDNFIVPGVAGGGGVGVDDVSINKHVCLRSLSGGTISSGAVYVSAW